MRGVRSRSSRWLASPWRASKPSKRGRFTWIFCFFFFASRRVFMLISASSLTLNRPPSLCCSTRDSPYDRRTSPWTSRCTQRCRTDLGRICSRYPGPSSPPAAHQPASPALAQAFEWKLEVFHGVSSGFYDLNATQKLCRRRVRVYSFLNKLLMPGRDSRVNDHSTARFFPQGPCVIACRAYRAAVY